MDTYTKKVRTLVKKFKTRDPFTIAEGLGINIRYVYYSSYFPKGMFTKKLRRKFIIINMTRIDNDYELKSIMAHELGHAILHSNDSDFYVHEYTFFSRRKFEIEANRFASEFLIDINNSNKDILKYYSLSQLSCYFKVPVEIVKLNFNIY